MDFNNIFAVAEKELKDAFRNRWFIVFTLAFAGLAFALSSLMQPESSRLPVASFSRTSASLVNLVLLFVPLLGLTLGATNIAGDRETGALTYLLSQPVNRAEVLLGKYLGIAGALFATLAVGFGIAGLALALQGSISSAGGYLLTVILAYLLALAMLSIGFLLSTFTDKTATALGSALFMWLLLVFIGDLGIMGTAVATQMPIDALFFSAVINPLQMFKIASILVIQANLEVLGPVGMYATATLGNLLLPMMITGLLIWIITPLAGASLIFTRMERTPRKANIA